VRRKWPIFLAILGLAAFAAFSCWMVEESSLLSSDWGPRLRPIWPYVAAGLLVVGGVTSILSSLAFHSSRRRYGKPADPQEPGSGQRAE
jgi:hypothetical protein